MFSFYQFSFIHCSSDDSHYSEETVDIVPVGTDNNILHSPSFHSSSLNLSTSSSISSSTIASRILSEFARTKGRGLVKLLIECLSTLFSDSLSLDHGSKKSHHHDYDFKDGRSNSINKNVICDINPEFLRNGSSTDDDDGGNDNVISTDTPPITLTNISLDPITIESSMDTIITDKNGNQIKNIKKDEMEFELRDLNIKKDEIYNDQSEDEIDIQDYNHTYYNQSKDNPIQIGNYHFDNDNKSNLDDGKYHLQKNNKDKEKLERLEKERLEKQYSSQIEMSILNVNSDQSNSPLIINHKDHDYDHDTLFHSPIYLDSFSFDESIIEQGELPKEIVKKSKDHVDSIDDHVVNVDIDSIDSIDLDSSNDHLKSHVERIESFQIRDDDVDDWNLITRQV